MVDKDADAGGAPTSGAKAYVDSLRSSLSTRNQPVKRYDGEPLTRADVQHAMLCYLFSDTRRVFTNPRAGPRGAATSTFVHALGDAPNSEADKGLVASQPPAVQAEVAQAISGPFPTPVWPYGQSAGSARRSDETEAERESWRTRREAYLQWRDTHYPHSITPTAELAASDAGASDSAIDTTWAHPGAEKLTFKELYIEALMNSSKCTKSMREKCLLDEEYAEDFSKVCLLVNVGRINTTLAFYPEMKTILRSYHPVPSLQKSENTRRNMQDAPRMKSLLKAVLLPHERPGPPGGTATASAAARPDPSQDTEEVPGDLVEIARRLRRARAPPTSVVTLIFLLTQQAADVTALHFPAPYDVHSLFFPQHTHPLSAKQRAEAFLWLIYHYLEGPAAQPPDAPGAENPFDDARSRAARAQAASAWQAHGTPPLTETQPLWRGTPNPAYAHWKDTHETGATEEERKKARQRAEQTEPRPEAYTDRILIPSLDPIAPEALAAEDTDTPEEVEWGKQMQQERAAFLVRFQEEEQAKVLANGGTLDEDAPADESRPKKRVYPGSQSCYPLANILANAAAAGSHQGALARSPIGFVKRARLSSRQAQKDSRESSLIPMDTTAPERAEGTHQAPSLFDLALEEPARASQTSLLEETWQSIRATKNTESDPAATDEPFSSPALARILLVHRRLSQMAPDRS